METISDINLDMNEDIQDEEVQEVTVQTFQILENEPVFKKPQGRGKSQLRIAMENMPVGKSMVASEFSSPALLNNCRQKAQEIRSAAKINGDDFKFSVRTDVEGRIIVTRKS